MTIQWVTGFFDFPALEFDAGRYFWLGVTGYVLSRPRGPRGDFATLLPAEGDAYLRVQRIGHGPAGCHLDFHTPHWAEMAARADGLGARRDGYPCAILLDWRTALHDAIRARVLSLTTRSWPELMCAAG